MVLLEGELGAGKTTLVQFLLRTKGITQRVKSPTFDLVHLYEEPGLVVYHIDLYRVQSDEELDGLDLPTPGDAEALVLAEWGSRLASRYPEYFLCRLSVIEGIKRQIQIEAVGKTVSHRLIRWMEDLHGI